MSLLLRANARHIPLADGSVNCCVTSPPYWGLRDYGLEPEVWDGEPGCEHAFESVLVPAANGIIHAGGMSGETLSGSSATRKPRLSETCRCGAWRGVLGLEPSIDLYVAHIVQVFREVRRVLRDDGTLWINLGDSYASTGGAHGGRTDNQLGVGAKRTHESGAGDQAARIPPSGLKPKDLCMIPARVALALQADGWYLRSDIIWHKPNPMPESVTDRPTKAHEYLFLLAKSERYYFDADAIAEPASLDSHARYARGRSDDHKWADGGPGGQTIARTFERMRLGREGRNSRMHVNRDPAHAAEQIHRRAPGVHPKAAEPGKDVVDTRNKRTVWTIPTEPYSGAHFATFPPALVEPCIRAGCPEGGIVLDPFAGSGTVGMCAYLLGRRFILLDLKYQELQRQRIPPMAFLAVPLVSVNSEVARSAQRSEVAQSMGLDGVSEVGEET